METLRMAFPTLDLLSCIIATLPRASGSLLTLWLSMIASVGRSLRARTGGFLGKTLHEADPKCCHAKNARNCNGLRCLEESPSTEESTESQFGEDKTER